MKTRVSLNLYFNNGINFASANYQLVWEDIFRTLALASMFLVRLSLHNRFLLLEVIWNRYGDTIVNLVCIFEKIDFKHCKTALDINFLQICESFNVIPISQNICNFMLQTKVYEVELCMSCTTVKICTYIYYIHIYKYKNGLCHLS